MIAADTNVLVYAHRAETDLHEAAATELVLLTAASLAASARGNLVFDAPIVALCREHGISTILTNDRDFRRFEDPQVRLLGEPASTRAGRWPSRGLG